MYNYANAAFHRLTRITTSAHDAFPSSDLMTRQCITALFWFMKMQVTVERNKNNDNSNNAQPGLSTIVYKMYGKWQQIPSQVKSKMKNITFIMIYEPNSFIELQHQAASVCYFVLYLYKCIHSLSILYCIHFFCWSRKPVVLLWSQWSLWAFVQGRTPDWTWGGRQTDPWMPVHEISWSLGPCSCSLKPPIVPRVQIGDILYFIFFNRGTHLGEWWVHLESVIQGRGGCAVFPPVPGFSQLDQSTDSVVQKTHML